MSTAIRKRRRLRSAALGFAVVIALVHFVALPFAATKVRALAEAALSKELGGHATIGDVSISWLGTVRVRDVLVIDHEGERIVAIPEAVLEPQFYASLSGELHFEASIQNPVVDVRQAADGTWTRRTRADSSRDSGESENGDDAAHVFGTVRVSGGTIHFIGTAADTTIEALEATLAFLGRADRVEGELSFALVDAVGERGSATIAIASDRDGEPTTPDGILEIRLTDAPLAALKTFATPSVAARTSPPSKQPEYDYSARLNGTIAFFGTTKKFNCRADLTAEDLRVAVDGEVALHEPSFLFTLVAVVTTRRLDVSDLEIELLSNVLSGVINVQAKNLRSWFEDEPESPAVLAGVAAHLVYRPDALNPLIEGWYPESIHSISRRASGSDAEPIDLEFPDPISVPNLDALLSALRGTATIGLGHVQTEMIDADGIVDITFGDGSIEWKATLDPGIGDLVLSGALDPARLDSDLDASTAAPTTFVLRANRVSADSRLTPLLSFMHPAFAALDSLEASKVGGIVVCELDLSYDGALSSDVFAEGLDSFPTDKLRGTGSFEIQDAVFEGAPVLETMLAALGIDADEDLHVRPVRFGIEDGRIEYLEDWTWTIGGVRTTFTGSVGFDRTLDLAWNLPVTSAAIEEYALLSPLRGRTIRLPITGTASSPEFDWTAPLGDLGRSIVPASLVDVLGLGTSADRDESDAEDPDVLLVDAGRLWDEGKKAEAAAIYREIRAKHKFSLTYVLNRSRIKRRARYEPPADNPR